jgi:hypothetical protein
LAAIGIEEDGAFGVVIFEAFGFGEAEGNLGGGVVGEMFLDCFWRDQRHFVHDIKFIMMFE